MNNPKGAIGDVGDSIFLPSEYFGHVEHKITDINTREKCYKCRVVGTDKHGTISFDAARYYHVEDLPYLNRTQKNMQHF